MVRVLSWCTGFGSLLSCLLLWRLSGKKIGFPAWPVIWRRQGTMVASAPPLSPCCSRTHTFDYPRVLGDSDCCESDLVRGRSVTGRNSSQGISRLGSLAMVSPADENLFLFLFPFLFLPFPKIVLLVGAPAGGRDPQVPHPSRGGFPAGPEDGKELRSFRSPRHRYPIPEDTCNQCSAGCNHLRSMGWLRFFYRKPLVRGTMVACNQCRKLSKTSFS